MLNVFSSTIPGSPLRAWRKQSHENQVLFKALSGCQRQHQSSQLEIQFKYHKKSNSLVWVTWTSGVDLDSCTLKSRALVRLSGLYLHPSTLLLAVCHFNFFLLMMSFSHVVFKETSGGTSYPCFQCNSTRGGN